MGHLSKVDQGRLFIMYTPFKNKNNYDVHFIFNDVGMVVAE